MIYILDCLIFNLKIEFFYIYCIKEVIQLMKKIQGYKNI